MDIMEELQHLNIRLEDIKLATDNFDDNSVIGIGGFGKVYKGEIKHSKGKSMVAVKRLDRKYGQGDREFLKEIDLLSRYTHENLISLLGFSNEGDEKILVYEYASRGSLDRHLTDGNLVWSQRLKICLAAAKGLSYLHDPHTTHQRVLHCDIKSSNILLDENWNAKISDFGLSKIGPANEPYTFLVTNAVGTPGYCDPQFMKTYTLTKESDVYSFGVVLFEALCGRLCFEYVDRQLSVYVPTWKQKYEENNLDEIIFQDMKQEIVRSSLKVFSDIAYQCLQDSRQRRPTMGIVLKRLELALEFQKSYEEREKEEKVRPRFRDQDVNDPASAKDIIASSEKFTDDRDVNEPGITTLLTKSMTERENVRPMFGEWDVNDPASAEGFTVIFNKARDEKRQSAKQESSTNANHGNSDAGLRRKGKSIWNKIFR